MNLAYYSDEIPLAKIFIRNYLIFRCTQWGSISPEFAGQGSTGRGFIFDMRDTWRYIINREKQRVFLDSYKQYLQALEYLESPYHTPVGATIFKRLIAKERRVLKLVRGLVKDKDYQGNHDDTYDEVIDFIKTQESQPLP